MKCNRFGFKQSTTVQLRGVIPGRCEASNPESRDSGSGPSDHPGMTKVGLLRRFAPRNDVKNFMTPHSRGARRPRFCKDRSPINQRAQGMPGAQCTRRRLACNVKWHTSVVTTVTPEITRHSPRNGFTAYAALSPATSSCCHRHPRIKVLSARSGRLASANLAPATGARTTRFCRTQKAPIILHAAFRSRGSSRPAIALRA
jgi:hypothetical protein